MSEISTPSNSSAPITNKVLKFFLILLSGGLLAYTLTRAHLVGITHDEANTFFNAQELKIWKCFFREYCWSNANNHLLNSWLLQGTTWLLGDSELAIRLPNVLGHLLYLYCSVGLILLTTNRFWIGLAGFALLNLNPYLLEFFSLARGYGLSTACLMASIYWMALYFHRDRLWDLVAVFGWLFLAVLANFTALNFFASAWAALFFTTIVLIWRKPWQEKIARLGRNNWLPVAFGGGLAFLLWKPIQWLQGKGEFEFGTGNVWDTFVNLNKDSLYGTSILGGDTVWVAGTTTYSLVLTAFVLGFIALRKRYHSPNSQFFVWINLFFVFAVSAMIVQNALLGTEYLVNRKAIYFIPIMGTMVFFGLEYIRHQSKVITTVAAVILTGLAAWHLARVGNLESTREWWYDKDNQLVFKELPQSMGSASVPLNFGAEWVYFPALKYYYQRGDLPFIAEPAWQPSVEKEDRFDLYLVQSDKVNLLSENYEVVKSYSTGATLLRLKKELIIKK